MFQVTLVLLGEGPVAARPLIVLKSFDSQEQREPALARHPEAELGALIGCLVRGTIVDAQANRYKGRPTPLMVAAQQRLFVTASVRTHSPGLALSLISGKSFTENMGPGWDGDGKKEGAPGAR
jgi:hypothetical protein